MKMYKADDIAIQNDILAPGLSNTVGLAFCARNNCLYFANNNEC